MLKHVFGYDAVLKEQPDQMTYGTPATSCAMIPKSSTKLEESVLLRTALCERRSRLSLLSFVHVLQYRQLAASPLITEGMTAEQINSACCLKRSKPPAAGEVV
jgi:hypothetical protein